MWKVFKVYKKDTSKTRVNCCSTLVRFEQTLHLVWVLLWPFFEKQANVRCGIGSILMSITSDIHNAANHAIGKNSCHSCFKKLEVLFSRKLQGAIRTDWKIYLAFSATLHNGKDFSRGYLTFDILNKRLLWHNTENSNFIFLPVLIET